MSGYYIDWYNNIGSIVRSVSTYLTGDNMLIIQLSLTSIIAVIVINKWINGNATSADILDAAISQLFGKENPSKAVDAFAMKHNYTLAKVFVEKLGNNGNVKTPPESLSTKLFSANKSAVSSTTQNFILSWAALRACQKLWYDVPLRSLSLKTVGLCDAVIQCEDGHYEVVYVTFDPKLRTTHLILASLYAEMLKDVLSLPAKPDAFVIVINSATRAADYIEVHSDASKYLTGHCDPEPEAPIIEHKKPDLTILVKLLYDYEKELMRKLNLDDLKNLTEQDIEMHLQPSRGMIYLPYFKTFLNYEAKAEDQRSHTPVSKINAGVRSLITYLCLRERGFKILEAGPKDIRDMSLNSFFPQEENKEKKRGEVWTKPIGETRAKRFFDELSTASIE